MRLESFKSLSKRFKRCRSPLYKQIKVVSVFQGEDEVVGMETGISPGTQLYLLAGAPGTQSPAQGN